MSDSQLSLTIEERAELERCERVIQSGLDTFELVGNALMSVRDAKLYRLTHSTFADYCRERWGIAKSTAYQYIDAAKAVENVRNCGHSAPETESQARPLTSLEPEQQKEAWAEAVETSGGKPTAKHVEAAVEKVKRKGEAVDTDTNGAASEQVDTTSSVAVEPISVAARCADLAISALAKIPKGDKGRAAALRSVVDWIDTH